MQALPYIIGLSMFLSCTAVEPKTDLTFLAGEWKQENKEQYETWELTDAGNLEGHSYTIKEGQKEIWETLTITEIGDQIIYKATVPDQNEGATIPFYLNPVIKDYLSFENLDHDFPKKIQYKHISKEQIEVQVLGEEGQGFSFVLIKQ